MIHLEITGMTCDPCAAQIKEALEKLPGMYSALVSYPPGKAKLSTVPGTPLSVPTATMGSLGYQAALADIPPVSLRGQVARQDA